MIFGSGDSEFMSVILAAWLKEANDYTHSSIKEIHGITRGRTWLDERGKRADEIARHRGGVADANGAGLVKKVPRSLVVTGALFANLLCFYAVAFAFRQRLYWNLRFWGAEGVFATVPLLAFHRL